MIYDLWLMSNLKNKNQIEKEKLQIIIIIENELKSFIIIWM